ncbi:MAG TPA: hypothetical protein VMN57_12350 [Anaerolineales bacterium]|nr:hypothetical protein [Anaerolineales bacterium]
MSDPIDAAHEVGEFLSELGIDYVVIARHGMGLNIGYLRTWLARFSEIMENDQISERFEEVWKQQMGSDETVD